MTFHYYIIGRRLIIHAHGDEYLGGLQLRSSYGRPATAKYNQWPLNTEEIQNSRKTSQHSL